MNKVIRHKLVFALSCIGLTIAATACKTTKQNQGEQLAGVAPIVGFAFNKKGECYAKKVRKLTEKEFKELTSSGGLFCLSTRIINEDGTLFDKDYHAMRIGSSPISYYFKDGKCNSFFFSSAKGKTVTYENDFRYDVKQNTLTISNGVQLNIVDYNDDTLGAIIQMGFSDKDKKQYAYVVYRRAGNAEVFNRLFDAGVSIPIKDNHIIVE